VKLVVIGLAAGFFSALFGVGGGIVIVPLLVLVARFEQRQVLLVLYLGSGQQPGRLQIEQGGCDDEELGGLVQVPVGAHGVDVRDELIGDLGEGHLGDVQLVLRDQLKEQVERALEVGQPDREPAVVSRRFVPRRGLAHRGWR